MAAMQQLSQRDIDTLLGRSGPGQTGVTAGPPADRAYKRYNFRKPDKFSKDHLRALQVLFEQFGRLSSNQLSGMFRGQVQVRLSSLEQLPYEEYVAQLPKATSAALVSCDPLPDRLILEISLPLASAMFDRLLGGSGRPAQGPKEVTDIEASLLHLVVQRLLPCLVEAWSGITPMEPRLESLVFNTAYIPMAVPGTAAALVVLEATMIGFTGTITIAIPYTVLEPVMSKLNTQKWLSAPTQQEHSGEFPQSDRSLQRAEVSVKALLGATTLPLHEVLRLQRGDVIRLGTSVGDEIAVTIGGQHKFGALPGMVGNNVAVQITRLVENDS